MFGPSVGPNTQGTEKILQLKPSSLGDVIVMFDGDRLSSPEILVKSHKQTPINTWLVVKPDTSLHMNLASNDAIISKSSNIGNSADDFLPLSSLISTVFKSIESDIANTTDIHFEYTSKGIGVVDKSVGIKRRSLSVSSFVLHSRNSIRRYSRLKGSLEKV
jgi:hypothetical protein